MAHNWRWARFLFLSVLQLHWFSMDFLLCAFLFRFLFPHIRPIPTLWRMFFSSLFQCLLFFLLQKIVLHSLKLDSFPFFLHRQLFFFLFKIYSPHNNFFYLILKRFQLLLCFTVNSMGNQSGLFFFITLDDWSEAFTVPFNHFYCGLNANGFPIACRLSSEKKTRCKMRYLQSALHTREINVFCFKPLLRPSIQAIWHIDGILLQMQILLQEKLNAEQERKKAKSTHEPTAQKRWAIRFSCNA